MSTDLELVDGDITFTEGDVQSFSGIREVAQRAKDRLQTFRTEWFLDQDYGPNYIRDILKKSPSLTLVRSVLVAQTNLAIGDEASLSEFELAHDQTARKIEVSFVLRDPETEEEAKTQVVIG